MLDQESNLVIDSQVERSLADYQRLRTLLLGEDYEKIIQNRVVQDNVERISGSLTEAFKLRNSRDNSLAKEMAPVIESAIDESIKSHPEKITNVIFPIIGPAVRKAVSTALADLMHSLNYLLQNSLSTKSLLWRFKAWKLGIPYGQYALLQTIQYRVEQIFFIERESGVLIQSAQANDVNYQDPDLVSSMLTAINDFAKDSFGQESEGIETIQFGDLSLIIESGPFAVIAFAVRGSLHKDVKQELSLLNEKLHASYSKELKTLNGDTEPLSSSQQILQDSLLTKEKSDSESKPWFAIVTVFVLIMLIGYFVYQRSILENEIQRNIGLINQTEGYRVLSHQLEGDQLTFEVWRSPLAIPKEILQDKIAISGLNIAIDSLLASIGTTELYLPYLANKYQLQLSTRDEQGKTHLIVSGVTSAENLLNLSKDPLVANYFVVKPSEQLQYKANLSVREKSRLEFNGLVKQINSTNFYFEVASSTLKQSSLEELNHVIVSLKRLFELQPLTNSRISQISVTGFADTQGASQANIDLSEQRAKLLHRILGGNDISLNLLVSWGVGAKDLSSVPTELQRRARIEVLYQTEEGFDNGQ